MENHRLNNRGAALHKLPVGTQIYVGKKGGHIFYLKPGKILLDDNLYVLYDVRVGGDVVIPKGSRVVGNWISEEYPLAMQLQITKVYVVDDGQDLFADSDPMEGNVILDSKEIHNADHMYGQARKLAVGAGIIHGKYYPTQNVTYNSRQKKIVNTNPDSVYLCAPTKEIPVYIVKDFVGYPNLHNVKKINT